MTIKGATSDNIIIPEAQGYLQVPTITRGVMIDVLCYYSPEFTSTLLSDNDVILSNKNSGDYTGQLMLKFFNHKELDEMEELSISKLRQQAASIEKEIGQYNRGVYSKSRKLNALLHSQE